MDRVLAEDFAAPDLEFAWNEDRALSPSEAMSVNTAYVAAGLKTRNEVRTEIGLDPLPGGDTALVTTATGLIRSRPHRKSPSTALPSRATRPARATAASGQALAVTKLAHRVLPNRQIVTQLTINSNSDELLQQIGTKDYLHNWLRDDLASYLESKGANVIKEVPVTSVDGTTTFVDIVAWAPGHPPSVIEVKTGKSATYIGNQAKVYPMIQLGNHVTSIDPRVALVGLVPDKPFPAMNIIIAHQIAPELPLDIKTLPGPFFQEP